eukprot:11166483-Alexandrium_andersonii.AAC.1
MGRVVGRAGESVPTNRRTPPALPRPAPPAATPRRAPRQARAPPPLGRRRHRALKARAHLGKSSAG